MALRQKHGLPIPTDAPVVFVEGVSMHHVRMVVSAIASRDQAGVWTVSQVSEHTAALLQIEPRLMPETIRTLTTEEGAELDRLVNTAPRHSNPQRPAALPGVGAWFNTMEVVGTDRRVIYQWTGRLTGHGGRIADLVIGAG